MGENYGKFSKKPGGYRIEKLPEAGNYEYIYKNDEILVKVDQYGIITAQINPPVGEAVFKREEREVGSPVKAYFSATAPGSPPARTEKAYSTILTCSALIS